MNFNHFFQNVHTIAVVGLSDKPERYSYQVADYLQSQGFRIIPVNPNIKEVLGEKAYPDIRSIPQTITVDVIDIFRRSELVLPHVKEAIERSGIHTVWMQEGVENEEAAMLARTHDMQVVMNFCLMIAHKSQE